MVIVIQQFVFTIIVAQNQRFTILYKKSDGRMVNSSNCHNCFIQLFDQQIPLMNLFLGTGQC